MKFLFFFILLLLIGCSKEQPFVKDLEALEFNELIKEESVFVLDTHIPEQDHIKGTDALIPFDALEQNKDKLPLDKDAPIAVYCRSGRMSAEASQTLQHMGYTKVYNLLGGTKAWREKGLEFEG